MKTLYIGLMSGTSLDGVDGVLVEFPSLAQPKQGLPLKVVAHTHQAFSPALAQQFLVLNQAGTNELHHAALAANALARLYADVVNELLAQSTCAPHEVAAIGAHGQTVRHCPGEFDGLGYTWQINNPALLAELTGIDVVADFRSRDVAAGGQGAPLVPMFHQAVFSNCRRAAPRQGRTPLGGESEANGGQHTRPQADVAVLNIGGMSNLSILHADGRVTGWDCGPGNVLMDAWCQQHLGASFDDGGRWAASGRVIGSLLQRCLAEPYFARPAPKSTGRDLFSVKWLADHLQHQKANPTPQDVQATLVELTAQTCANDLLRYASQSTHLGVCGGGALNAHLMNRLAALLPKIKVTSTDTFGLPATQVEACAFAWLARACMQREAVSQPSVTAAKAARILGAIYPGLPSYMGPQ